MIKEIDGEKSEEEDEDEKDMFPFHFNPMSVSLPCRCVEFGVQIYKTFGH